MYKNIVYPLKESGTVFITILAFAICLSLVFIVNAITVAINLIGIGFIVALAVTLPILYLNRITLKKEEIVIRRFGISCFNKRKIKYNEIRSVEAKKVKARFFPLTDRHYFVIRFYNEIKDESLIIDEDRFFKRDLSKFFHHLSDNYNIPYKTH